MNKTLLALAAFIAAACNLLKAEDIVSLAPRETSVVVRTQKNLKSFLRIPSPGFCYDDLKFAARVLTEESQTTFQVSMLAPTNQPDLVVMPYARILRPDYTELDSMTFSNALFWASGQLIAKRMTIPEKMKKYLIAVGYVFYKDARHRHIAGGPYETIINEKGIIVHRGHVKMKSEYVAKFSIDSNVIFLDDEIEIETVQELPDTPRKKGDTNEVSTVFSYTVVNLDSGKIVFNNEDVKKPCIKMKTTGNYAINVRISRGGVTFWHDMKIYIVLPRLEKTFDPNYLGKLSLNDGVVCGSSNDLHQLHDGRYSTVVKDHITQRYFASNITNIYGGKGRIITQDRGYFSYVLGVRLRLNMPYLLEIEYPEDLPRTMAFSINGGTYSPCIQTGHTMPYQFPRQFVEQIKLPLNQDVNKMQFIVWAGADEVKNGISIAVADPGEQNAPFSKKPLLLRVSLYSFLTIAMPQQKETFPEQYQRYVWTEGEEMMGSDGVGFAPVFNSYFSGLNACAPLALSWNSHASSNGTILFPTELYKTPLRAEIGGVEYKSNATEDSGLRANYMEGVTDMARYLKMKVFPRLEYGGSDLLHGKMARNQEGNPYEPYIHGRDSRPLSDSVDVTFPEVTEDFKKVVAAMVDSVKPKSRGVFRNMIIRQRANFTPVSYSDHALAKYAAEKGVKLEGEELRKEININRNEDYKAWYKQQKYAFWSEVNKYYNEKLGRDGKLVYYNWKEGGMPYENVYFYSQDEWNKVKTLRNLPVEGFPLPKITEDDLLAAVGKWTGSEEGYARDVFNFPILPVCPTYGTLSDTCEKYHNLFRKDPETLDFAIKVTPGVSSQSLVLDTNKRPAFAGQTMYRSREYSMYDALLAAVYTNPHYLIFEQSHQSCFPFTTIARRFFMNYLALPLVPFGQVEQNPGCKADVYVGVYDGKPYIAVVNEKLEPVRARISLPLSGVKNIRPLVGKARRVDFFLKGDTIELDVELAPLELRSYKAE